ncbi:MAG: hypothetical protein C0401_00235 [Anaerolinea sp.]|nr:hypothetical protein [Anaerolinea sp.]
MKKGINQNNYKSYKNTLHSFELISEVDKNDCSFFGFILNDLTNNEIHIAKKVWRNSRRFNELISNTRGGMFQKHLISETSDLKVLGGKQISRYSFNGIKGFCKIKAIKEFPNSIIQNESLLFQNIIAHIENPVPHVKLIGTISSEMNKQEYVILDTVNQLITNSEYSSKFLLGLLLSKFTNWYTYRFVFAKAIRTMHFDGPTTNKIPIIKLNMSNKKEVSQHDRMVALVERMLDLHKRTAAPLAALGGAKIATTPQEQERLARDIASTDREIDKLVYELYGLSAEEIKIVEGG